ncbi:TPA: hypothetical protein N2426_003476 [Escherichia coli]|nr:hypothetical protein [Escherichia coli]HAH2176682.1 hypothetical protein [Escherichia coli]HCK2209039.1 hypothetical protein [Escherichia coli]HCK2214107.1 hypothetical protein [Escherichia coli]HCK2511952.1 hypothetical protein [Escherichia coli]HCL9788966.1 hypothetical protein [Escherichia coli]
MKTLDVISTQLNFNNLLNQAGYNLSEIVVKRYSAAPAFNEGHWLFIAEQDNRYIEVVSLLSKASESGEQHVDIFINMFEDPIDDIISRNIDPKTFATLYKYIERIPFTPDVKKEFLSSIETINFS